MQPHSYMHACTMKTERVKICSLLCLVHCHSPTSCVSSESPNTRAVLSRPDLQTEVASTTQNHNTRRKESTAIHITNMTFQVPLLKIASKNFQIATTSLTEHSYKTDAQHFRSYTKIIFPSLVYPRFSCVSLPHPKLSIF